MTRESTDIETQLRSEIARLRTRLAELESRTGTDTTDSEIASLSNAILSRAATARAACRTPEDCDALAKRFDSLLDAIPDVIGVQDPHHGIIRYNAAGYEFLGMTHAEVLGKKCYELIGHESPCGQCATSEVYRTKKPAQIEKYVPEIRAWLDVRAYPILDTEGEILNVIEHIRDITPAKRAEEERARLQEQLRQSQRMESIGLLAGGVAHDFNNLLVPILGYAQLLLQGMDPGDRRHVQLTKLLRAGRRAQELTEQLLAFGRKQVMRMRTHDLNQVVTETADMLRLTVREDIRVRIHTGADLNCVNADMAQLQQVLMNLVSNAQDAMPDGGAIDVETANVEADDELCVRHPDLEPGAYVMLAVRDTGAGMAEEVRAHVFDPFFTTKARDKGTGLGLATVYGIVRQHQGAIWVESEPGAGTTFTIYLPRVDGEPTERDTPIATTADCTGTETILVAEDDDMVRELTLHILGKYGYRTLPASTGEDCLELAERTDGPIDLLLTDVVMSGMNGRGLYERLAAKRPGLKVLFMSGYTDNVIARHGVLEPETAFLQKPFSVDALVGKIREVLDR